MGRWVQPFHDLKHAQKFLPTGLSGGVLQRNNIHIAVCESGMVGETLKAIARDPQNCFC
jgi:hypothetical protein